MNLPRRCCILLLLACSLPTIARDEAGTEPAPIESVVVTAHRLPDSAPVLPVITRALEHAPAIGLEPLRDLPTFAISQSGALGTLTQVRVRGAEANHLLVLVDGIEMMDPATDTGFNFGNLNLAGFTALEYLPGAQSAIWGNHALAGVLQLSTEPATRIRNARFESGSFNSRLASVQLADARANGFYNLSFADFTTDGTNIARQGTERDGYDNRSGFASGGLTRERWSLRGLVHRTRTAAEFDPTPFPDFLPVDGDRENRHDAKLYAMTLDVAGETRPWQQRFTVSRFETANSTLSDGSRAASTDGRRTGFTSLTRFALTPAQRVDLLLEHREESFAQAGEPTPFGDPNQRQTLRTTSAGLDYVLHPAERWRFGISARHDHNRAFDDSRSVRFAASFLPSDETRMWAAAGTGIKQPSFVERFGFTPDSFIGNSDLEAEENRHLSAGIEHRRGPWLHTLTLYRDRLRNEINGFHFDPALGGFTAINEDGTSRRDGAELGTTLAWPGGSLEFGASVLDAVEDDGSREIRRPRRQAFAIVDHTHGRASARLAAYRIDQQVDLDFATFPARRVTLDAYTLVSAALRVTLADRVELGLRGTNLLDETYEDLLGYRAPGRAWYVHLGIDF
jgi:vitamin B12 transporter